MNSVNPPPAPPEPAKVPAPPPTKGPIMAGFVLGAVPWLLTLIAQKGYGVIPFLLFACFVMPVAAVVIALIPRTRRFGLGLLLASGLGWLVLGAICGGLIG